MRRSVAAPETGAGARVAAPAVAPAGLGAQGDTAGLVARAAVAVTAVLAGVPVAAAVTGGMADHATAVTGAVAVAATTVVPPVTGTTVAAGGTTGRAWTAAG